MGKKNDPTGLDPKRKGSVIVKDRKNESIIVSILYVLAVLALIGIIGKGLSKPDPEITPPPPSVPTDVGTLKPTR